MPSGTARPNAHAAHLRQVDDQPTVATAQTGAAVSASPDCEKQLVIARVVDRRYDISGVGAASDHLGPLIDHAVVQRSRLVVLLV